MDERWLPVPGFAGYEVSDLGRVRSVDRVVWDSLGRPRRLRGRVLRPQLQPDQGYRTVCLRVGGRSVTRRVHTLVMLAFAGPRPPGLEVCHGPGGSADDRLVNLRYDTPSENQLDIVRAGRHPRMRARLAREGRLTV